MTKYIFSGLALLIMTGCSEEQFPSENADSISWFDLENMRFVQFLKMVPARIQSEDSIVLYSAMKGKPTRLAASKN